MKLNEIEILVLELQARIEVLEQSGTASRRGPKSEQDMSDEHARRVIFGDLANASHKDAAKELGLSYAQVYSCRKFFTFKHIHKEHEEMQKATS